MNIRLEKDGAVATLTPDRPDKLNAMADPMWNALHADLGALARDDTV